MKQFKIRCSQIGRIMSEPRAKKDKEAGNLSKTTESYVKEWLTKEIYGFDKEIYSKEMQKGTDVESEAIELYALYKDSFYIKNDSFLENEIMTGTPDIITKEEVIDIKCPWDCYTFPAFETEIPNAMYYWQLQGYMALTNKLKARLVYGLMNTPIDLAYSDLDRADYNDLDMDLRFKEFNILRNDEDIEKIQTRVKQIRTYLKKLT